MKTRKELETEHGTPEEFKRACQKAYLDGFITSDEMYKAIEEYRVEYAMAASE